MGQEHDEVAAQLNQVLDESDDYLSAEIESFLNQRYVDDILEIHTEYSSGDNQYYPLDLILDNVL